MRRRWKRWNACALCIRGRRVSCAPCATDTWNWNGGRTPRRSKRLYWASCAIPTTERERQSLTVLRYQAAICLGDAPARVQALEALGERRSGSVPIAVSLGDSLLADGRRDEAWAVWERALRGTPRTVLLERLASISTESSHRERLRSVLQKLRPDQVRVDTVRLLSAELCLAEGNLDAAAQQLDGVREPATAPALLHALWGEVHRRRGQLELAVAAYARANGTRRMHQCGACDRASAQWIARCPACQSWDRYRSDVEIAT